MSAIFGLMSLTADEPLDRALLRMRSALAAHGGDGSSTWTGGGAGLGQELKRITPEDMAERQPLVSQDGLRAVVSDGRIDNRRELSGELRLSGESPKVPDSAFILAAYERWGDDCTSHLIGSFSFAVWDVRRKRLLLARSPFAAKPVFYHQAAEFVAFATTPGAIFALPGVPRKLNDQSVADLLILVPPEPGASLYQGIQSLEPGQVVTADRRGCRVRTFWSPELAHELRLGSDQDYVDAFTDLFDRVVADQLRSIKPVGMLLSGGLDSTSVAATAAPLLAKRGERLAAFTAAPRAGFREPAAPEWLIDEVPNAGAVADMYENLDHSVIRASGLFLDGLDRYFDAAEMPYEGTASRVWHEGIMTEARRRGISVLLTGRCGSLTVSWHGSSRGRSAAGLFARSGMFARSGALARNAALASAGEFARSGLIPRLPGAVQLAIMGRRSSDPLGAGEGWWSPMSPIHPEFARNQWVAERSRTRACDRWPVAAINTPAERLRRLMDDVHYISGINGAYSAMYGVDIRDPMADARIAEFCLSLPADQYSRQGVSRSLIRRAMADRLPSAILTSTRRGIDTADWFERLSGARATVHEELHLLGTNETARAVLDLARMREIADNFDAPPGDPGQRLLDFRLVLERGLMMGRFIRWFDGRHA